MAFSNLSQMRGEELRGGSVKAGGARPTKEELQLEESCQRRSLHGKTHLYAKQEGGNGGGVGVGRDQLIHHMSAGTSASPLFHKRPLFVEESVPQSM